MRGSDVARARTAVRTGALASALIGFTLVGGAPAVAGPPAAPVTGGWVRLGGPNPGPFNNLMTGIAAISDTDVWGVGFFMDARAVDHTLVEHWDGTGWALVSSPDAGPASQLIAVDAVATDDVWAVGVRENHGASMQRTLAEHWDGLAWTVVPTPNPPTAGSFVELTAVTALAEDDVWAAGWAENHARNTDDPLFEHWDGTSWSLVPGGATSARFAFLWGISATGPDDIWAVGTDQTSSTYRTFVEHWNGAAWSVVPSPNAGGSNELAAVRSIAPNDAWMVGSSHTEGTARTLTEHWNGAAWEVVPSPNQGDGHNHLYGATSLRSTDVWAVGSWANPASGAQRTLTERWDGTAWRIVGSPNAGTSVTLFGADALAPASVWVAGTSIEPPQLRTFFLHTARG